MAPSMPSFSSRSWNAGKNVSMLVRALKLSSSRHTTSVAAVSDMPNIGMAKYQSFATKRQNSCMFVFLPSPVGRGVGGGRVVQGLAPLAIDGHPFGVGPHFAGPD